MLISLVLILYGSYVGDVVEGGEQFIKTKGKAALRLYFINTN